MTKSITITFNEADEKSLLIYFKKKKITVLPLLESDEKVTKEEHLAGIAESINHVKAAIKGEMKLRNAWELLDELEAKQKQKVTL